MKKWTNAETARFRELCAAGLSSRTIADELGRSLSSIASRRRVLGLLQDEATRRANVEAGMAKVPVEVWRAIGRKAGKSGWTPERRKKNRQRMKRRMKRAKMQGLGNAVIAANPEMIVRRTEARMQTILGWCPPEYREERRFLVRVKKLPAVEADAIIRAKIAADKRRASEAEAAANGWSMKFQAELERARAGAPIIEIPRMRRAPPDYSPMGGSLNF